MFQISLTEAMKAKARISITGEFSHLRHVSQISSISIFDLAKIHARLGVNLVFCASFLRIELDSVVNRWARRNLLDSLAAIV
jgi:hypothetical protein